MMTSNHLSIVHVYNLSRQEVSFGEGKVLLSRLNDKVYATSARCTHYGAPLSRGVLTFDGRVVWYALIPLYCPLMRT
jgi:nitrite reductase/ring-hydroxylating ferredoxin subunit